MRNKTIETLGYIRWPSLVVVIAAMMGNAGAPHAILAAERGNESIGDELLHDLDPNLFGPPSPPAEAEPARPTFDKRILPGVTDDALGEDLGQSSPRHPLAQIEQNMKSAASLIRHRNTLAQADDVQQQVVADLDKLIEQLSKQCNCNGSASSNSPPKPSSKRSQTSAGKTGGKPGRGNAPARDSTSQVRPADPQAVNLAERKELMKDLWGHLPPQVREQMLQSYSDEYLPEYELEIEAYFRRLAEEPAERHAP